MQSEEINIGAKVEIKNLKKYFDVVKAVDGVSLDAEAGSFVTLLGPSGSGKSTILNIITGFLIPNDGEILIDGQSITNEPTHKRNIGMVFQNYALFPHMTAAKNIAYPLEMRSLSKSLIREKVREVFSIVKLEGFENRYPQQLSGGQQQRIALARALVFNPPLLLMDEPLGALDKKLREHMQIEIKQIQRRMGITVIYVTHDQEEALTMSDKIAILNDGRLQQTGKPLQIYERPQNRFVAEFIGETNLLKGRISQEENQLTLAIEGLREPLKLPWDIDLAPGDITVSIRPEKLWIEEKCEGRPRFEGEVMDLIYVGESTKYMIKTLENTLNVRIQNRTMDHFLNRGDLVTVGFNPADLVHFSNN